jgi:uncharacterized protein
MVGIETRTAVAGALAETREMILQLAAQHGARTVRVFGSFARGDQRPDSDVDFLVDFEPHRSLLDRIALIQDLQDLLQRKVDIATPKGLHDSIRRRVLAEAVLL